MTDMTNPSGAAPSRYIPAIDGLRAIAVAAVFLYHLNPGLLPAGFVGVDVFFVISGFVVCHAVLQMNKSLSFLELCSQFYARRIVRIAPALIACLLITGVVSTLFIPQTWLSQVNNKTAFAAFFGLSNFVLYSSAGDYFSPRAEFNPFTHTWSLAVEEQFYLIFPALVFGAAFVRPERWRAAAHIAMVALVLGSLWLCVSWSASEPAKAFYLLPARYWELGAGVLACLACHHLGSGASVQAASLPRQVLALAAVAGLLVSLFIARADAFPHPWALLPVAATTALVVVFAGPRTWVADLLTKRPFMWLGLRSYSIYLWHWPVFILFKWTVGLEGPLNAAAASSLAVALGALSYRLIENPIRHAPAVRRQTRPRVIFAGLATVTSVALATGVVFKARPQISLSVTADEKTWFPYEKEDFATTRERCAVQRASSSLQEWGGEVIQFNPIGCQLPHRGRLFVAGDSHATAYTLMLKRYAAETGSPVTIFTLPNCPFLTLQKPNAEQPSRCAAFVQAALQAITRQATPADTVFFAALRVPRLSNQDRQEVTDIGAALSRPQRDRSAAVAEAAELLEPLMATGARVVFEAPKPVAPSPTFRCADWFNKMNPVCAGGPSVPAEAMARYLGPARQALQSLIERVGHGEVWDPGRFFCDARQCSAYKDGKPVIFDGDHITGHANELLLPDFKRLMLSEGVTARPLMQGGVGEGLIEHR